MATRLPDKSQPVLRGLSKSTPGVLLRQLFRVIQDVYRECGVHSKTLRQQRRSKIRKSGSKDLTIHVSGSVEVPESRIVLSINGITLEAVPESQVGQQQVECVADSVCEGECGTAGGAVDNAVDNNVDNNVSEEPEVVPEQSEVTDVLEQAEVIVKRHPRTASSQNDQSEGELSGDGLSGDGFTTGMGGTDGLQISQPYPYESESLSLEQQLDPDSTFEDAIDEDDADSTELTDDLFSSGPVLNSILSSSLHPEQLNGRAIAGWVDFPTDEWSAEFHGTRSSGSGPDFSLELIADSSAEDQSREWSTWDLSATTASQVRVDRFNRREKFGDLIGDQSEETGIGLQQLTAELMLTMAQPFQLFPFRESDGRLTDVLFDAEFGAAIQKDSAISNLFASWIGQVEELPAAGNLLSSTSGSARAGANRTSVEFRLTTVSESGTEVNRIRLVTISRQKTWDVELPRMVLSGEPPSEASEFGVLGQLKFHMDPRGPPGAQRSDPLTQKIESNADAEQLRRLRYSIAPRGPSLVV